MATDVSIIGQSARVHGRVVGTAVARALLANPKFQQDLATARAEFAEVQKARLQPAAAP